MKNTNFWKSSLMILLFCFGLTSLWGQTSVQTFGTGTGTHSSTTQSTSFFPNPTSGTTYVRGGGGGTAPIVLATVSNPLGTTDTYVRAAASSSTSVAKFSPAVNYTGSTEFYTSFKVLFGNASGAATANSGSWTFYQGSGNTYNNNTDFASADVFTGLRFNYTNDGLVTVENRTSSWTNPDISITQGVVHTIEIVGNNATSGVVNYSYNGVDQSVAFGTYDFYVDGVLVGNDLQKGARTAGATINSTTFIGISSTSNIANIFVDDVVIYNDIPESIGTPPLPSYTLTYTAGINGTIDGISPQTVEEGENGTAVTAVPNEGYHFVNWSDDSTDNPRTDTNVTGDITVTANFAINTYTVTYDGNGNDGGTAPVDGDSPYDHGSNVTVMGQGTLTLTDHSFLGWNTQADGSGNFYAESAEITNITSDITLYAQWLDDSLEPQTITFDPLTDATYGDAAFELTATSDSGLTVSYASSNESVATISGSTVTIVGVGMTDITASQTGDEDYQPAVPVVQTLTVNQKNLTISGVTVADKTYDGTTIATIDISGAMLVGTVGDDDVSFATGAGEFVSADAGEDIAVLLTSDFSLTGTDVANYTLTQPTLTGNILKANQTATLSDLNVYLGDEDIALPTVTDQGITIEYISDNEDVATIDGNILSIVGVGTAEILAGNDGDTNYDTFTDSFSITVTAAPVIYEDFTDGNFTNNPIWSGDTAGFTVINNATFPNGNASTDGFYLAGISGAPARYILMTPSTEVSEWQFSLGSNSFNPASGNYFGVILMASESVSGAITDTNFTGYYLKIGADGSNDRIELWRKTGTNQTSVGEFNVNVSSALPNGLNIRVTRDENGTFELFYSTGFTLEETPTTSAGTLTNNIYNTSAYFGVYQSMTNDGNRRVYFDNLMITPPAPAFITWTEENEWSNETGPTINDDVIIEGTLFVGTDWPSFEAKSLTVLSEGALYIESGNSVTVAGVINNQAAGNFIVESGANLIQNTDFTGANDGAITVIRNSEPMKRLDYAMWSSPVVGQNLFGFSPLTVNGVTNYTNPPAEGRIYIYNGTEGYEHPDPFTAEAVMNVGIGYLFRAPNNYHATDMVSYEGTFIGVPNNGTIQVALTDIPGTEDPYTSMGNPYPSNIRARGVDSFFSVNTHVNSVHFWLNEGSGAYLSCSTGGCTDTSDLDFISAGQGFIVEHLIGETADVTFTNAMRVGDAASFYNKTDEAERHRFWLNLNNDANGSLNQILTGYMENATNGIDHQIDAKLFGYEGSALYNLIEEEQFVIQGRTLPFEASDVVPLGFRAAEGGKFKISLANFDGLFAEGAVTIYLKDNQLDVYHNLMESDYAFESVQGTFKERFEVVYETEGTMGTGDFDSGLVQIYQHNNHIVVSSKTEKILSVELFDLQGRNIHRNAKVNTNLYQIPSASFGTQVLVVKVQTENGEVVTKKLINK